MNLERWFQNELLTFFQGRILPITYAIADRWALLSSRLERRGKTQPIFDSFMAVTALEHD